MITQKQQLGFALPLTILIVAVLIIAGAVGYYFYKTKYEYTSPEKTFSLFIRAMEKGDIDAYSECFTEESRETLRGAPEFILEVLKTDVLNIRDLQSYKEGIKVIEKTDDRAVMGSDIDNTGVLVFKKEEGNWKIDIEETLEPPRQKARDAKRVADLMGGLRLALEFYFADHVSYPVLTDTSEDGEFLKVLIDEGYLAEMFLDPLHPKYFYEYEGTKNSYILKCYCEIEGGSCDMVDGTKNHVFIYSYSPEEIPEEKEKERPPSVESLIAEMVKLEESLKNLQSSFSPAIKNLAWRVADNETTITGHAETQEDVLKLKEALEKIPQLTEVKCPVSTWMKSEDIDFTFTAKFKSEF